VSGALPFDSRHDPNGRPSCEHPVLLFDGVCNLCNGTVSFLLAHDRARRLRFAALQTPLGGELLRRSGLPGDVSTLVLIEGGRISTRSTAVLRALRHLGGPWKLAPLLLVIPRGLRDAAYALIARNRYRWFGRREQCRRPQPADEGRLLE
jgi:predicted DCC family thiol-disulfide oxidoreductase YuxK